jgi:uncharacterized membrane-anchored protein YitT (DUF2179 family)
VIGISNVLYAFIALLSLKDYRALQEGLTAAKLIYVISDKAGEIAEQISGQLVRGATFIKARVVLGEEKKC